MDDLAFAADRQERLTGADDRLRPLVREALRRYAANESDWIDGLLGPAERLWTENYVAESAGRPGESTAARFRKDARKGLRQTTRPTEVTDAQIDRVTHWLSGLAVNDGTISGAARAGVKFKRWVAMDDEKTRATHHAADGQTVPMGGTFDVGGSRMAFPGDPSAPLDEVINCRCVMRPSSKTGEAMTATTQTLEPDAVIDDAPNIVRGEKVRAALAAGGAVVEVNSEAGTTFFGPFDTAENARAWVESDGGPWDGEFGVISLTDPEDVAPADDSVQADAKLNEEALADGEDDDEPDITELPVHGVIAPEGVPTGDGRMFSVGALSTRNLPIPLRAEILSTHGGNTSDVVTIGRVDEAWRNDETNQWEWRGAIVLSKPHANETIEGIIDGTVRGVSLDGDDAEVEAASLEDGGEATVFSKMRVAGLTIVPIPAFQEAYIALGHEFARKLTPEDEAALAACGCAEAPADDEFREVPAEERKRMADEGTAMPDGSFPIADEEDLRNAIQAIGRAKDPAAARAHIKKRAKALGHPELIPEDWSAEIIDLSALSDDERAQYDMLDPFDQDVFADEHPQMILAAAMFAPGTHDGPGWVTNPVATSRIRRYWTHGKGAAKIRWGVGGDFNRCRKQLAKYVQNPEWLAGLCANMHKEALGIWPATHAKATGHSVETAPMARLVASGRAVYAAELFAEPTEPRAYPLRIDRETRRMHGYAAEWGSCHIGVQGGCTTAPHSRSDYGYFRKGTVETTAGQQRVATITYGIGHASDRMRAAAATAHYDKTDAVRAYINIGENDRGIWYSGVLAPWVTDEDIDAMLAIGAVSGDWRNWSGLPDDLEMVGLVVVNTPGFQLAASGGVQTALIAAGALQPESLTAAGPANRMDADIMAGLVRTAVEEYRHQEKMSARASAARQVLREARIAAVRTKNEGA